MDDYGLYIHVPFCQSRCLYCDFYSAGSHSAVPDAYVDALLRELQRRRATGRLRRPHTLYFGGGTPSLLSRAQLAKLVRMADPLPGAEVTLEANPGPALLPKLAGFLDAGANRLSLGAQSARDVSLRALGRPHTAADTRSALRAAHEAGFANLSGDIMLALPGYSRAEFDETLALLAEGGATHISAYLLKLEPGTPMGNTPPGGLPSPDEAAEHYLYACGQLSAAGFAQYEISNFAQPGFEGRHNLLYWDSRDWLGIGPGAHSCLAGRRFSTPPDVDAFVSGSAVPQDEGPLTADDYIMLRLRLTAGLSEDALFARFGRRLSTRQRAFLARCEAEGLALQAPGGAWALAPRGMLVQNSILVELLR